MLYIGEFSDINDNIYEVRINTGTSTVEVPITLSGNPVIITTSSDGLFSPIKSRSCSIEIVSPTYYWDLYTPTSRGTTVRVNKKTEPTQTLFFGYLTPCEYTQSYTYLDAITLEAVDALSTSRDFKWENDGTYKTFFDIIISILKDCGYTGKLYVPQTYTAINGSEEESDVIKKLFISSANFVDDDEAHTPWTQYEVVEEILKFLGWSMTPFGNDVFIIDYKSTSSGSVDYIKYDIQNSAISYPDTGRESIFNVSDYEAAGTPSLSFDDIYNKIEISDNLYKIDSISPDIFDDANHISVTEERGLGASGTIWTKTQTKKFLWWTTSQTNDITGYDYQTFCRLKPESGWKHMFYDMRDQSLREYDDGKEYYQPNLGQNYNGSDVNSINKYINTQGCLLQHYAHVKEEGKNNLPTSLSWNNILTFFIMNDKIKGNGVFTYEDVLDFEVPVLEYEISENINWKPSSGKSWITISGDLYYQYNSASYKDGKTDGTLNIINDSKRFYVTTPVDESVNISTGKYLGLSRSYSSEYYGLGFSMWKMKLQIGQKYWNGESWVNYPTTFYVKYNNGPSDREDETLPSFGWMSPVNTSDYKDKVGVDGCCIPIDSGINSDPSFGNLKLTLYLPSLIPNELVWLFQTLYSNSSYGISWKNLPPVIYCKNFELGYVYTDTGSWYKNTITSINDSDKVYIGNINDSYVKDFDGIELKINTTSKDKPISRSYVSLSNGYLQTLAHDDGEDKVQEYNLVDLYLDHFSEKKIIYECNLHSLFDPDTKFEYSHLGGVFVIDSQSYNVRDNINSIKLIQF